MGAGGSLPNNYKTQEPPPLPPPFYTGNSQYGVSRLSGSHCDDRRASGNSTVNSTSLGYPDPRSSESLKNEEWWHRRPSAPSLSSLHPQQETLLTYAAQMTGWQSGPGSAVPSMHHEAMGLARTVSHLAAANQQLASAHTTLLAQLESLYRELNRERALRIESNRDSSARKRPTSNDDDNNDKMSSTLNDDLKLRLGYSDVAGESKIIAQPTGRLSRKRNFGTDEDSRRIIIDKRCKGPRHDENRRIIKDDVETDLSVEYRRAIERIYVLENELENSCKRDVLDESMELRVKTEDQVEIADDEIVERSARSDARNCDNKDEMRGLIEEMKRMENERLEYRNVNEKLISDLESQKLSIEKLRRDYEISRTQYEKVECSLMERKKQLNELRKDFDIAKSETTRLMKELQVFHVEKDTATARIADLEKDLAKSALINEQIDNTEIRESSRLRKKLSEELTNKSEQSKALDDALKEIRRLNEMIEAGGKNQQAGGVEEVSEIEPTHDEEILDADVTVPRSSNMEDFRKELGLKREARQRAIAAVSSEMDRLSRELDAEKEAHSETSRVLDLLKSAQATNDVIKRATGNNVPTNAQVNEEPVEDDWRAKMKPNLEETTNEADAQSLTDILKVSDELRSSIRLQTEKIDDLRYHLECEPEGHRNRIENLKVIGQKSREASSYRERQINKLKNLLAQIIARLGDPRFRVEITDDVRAEHDRQIEDIKRLKSLYDERLRILVDLRDIAFKELTDVKDKLKGSRKENVGLEEDLRKAEGKIDNQDTEISNLESQLGLTKADCRDLQNQMSVINGLFTQMLLSASSADMDLDRLTRLLQENHDLISDMAREEGTEAAALPKLLLDLVEQVEGRGGNKSADGETEKKDDTPKEENIAHNLPKVWRVLLELLSCHAVESPAVVPASLSTDPNSCYKSVDTPSGPRLVISVSKTYIRLKELILEKKHLEKEMNRMKQLNTHLESKLGEQEKRLSTVSSELSKTWNVVGRMQAQHQQLHTHEKILRYELQQKRKMLQELKQELEYCREKWESARQKNTNTEIEWRSLRREFAARKSLAAQDSFNNSGESGFSDERGDDSDEEDEAVEESRVRIGPRRRARKENARAPTPDTESEQPTDTEASETKTGSTSTPEQRTPTPETALPICDASSPSTSANTTEKSSQSEHGLRRSKPINPLDQALATVIQNLITIDDTNACQPVVKTAEIRNENIVQFSSSHPVLLDTDEATVPIGSPQNCAIEERLSIEDTEKMNESYASEDADRECSEAIEEIVSTVSVFSIGPFPTSSVSSPSKTVQFSDPLVVGPSTQPSTLPALTDNIEEPTPPTQTESKNETTIHEIQSIVKEEEIKSDARVPIGFEEPPENSKESRESVSLCDETELPSSSNAESPTRSVRTHEEVLAARAARLKRLEEQADWLMKKMSATSRRGSALSIRLEELHEAYGEPPAPPPMPDVLPNVRLPSNMDRQQVENEIVYEAANETPQPGAP